MPNVGGKLKELRRRRGLSIREIAGRSGVSHSATSQIERDRMSPSIDTLGAVLDALGTTLTSFFSDLRFPVARSPFYGAADPVEIGNASGISHRMVGANHPDRQVLREPTRWGSAPPLPTPRRRPAS